MRTRNAFEHQHQRKAVAGNVREREKSPDDAGDEKRGHCTVYLGGDEAQRTLLGRDDQKRRARVDFCRRCQPDAALRSRDQQFVGNILKLAVIEFLFIREAVVGKLYARPRDAARVPVATTIEDSSRFFRI